MPRRNHPHTKPQGHKTPKRVSQREVREYLGHTDVPKPLTHTLSNIISPSVLREMYAVGLFKQS